MTNNNEINKDLNKFYNVNESFIQSKKQISICNLTSYQKVTVYGPNAIDLINKYSLRKINNIKDTSFFTILMKGKQFLGEVQIIKLSPLKYIILGENLKKILKTLNKSKRKFPLLTVADSSSYYSFFSFHGDKTHSYFEINKSPNLYKVSHQHYIYYTLLTSNINKFAVLDHFKSLGFFEISLATFNLFLYNNSVVTNLEKIKKRFRLKTYISLYNSDNYKITQKDKKVVVKQFEVTKNILCTFGMKLYDNNHKIVGYVHNFYRLPYKKNPIVLGIINKYRINKLAILKVNKEELLVKEYMKY